MSMDLLIYATCTLSFPVDLPEKEHWKNYGGSDWAYEAEGWQVIVDIDTEYEIPKAVRGLKENLKCIYPVTLEPIGANEEGYEFFEKTTQKIIAKCGGGVIEGPSGFKVH